MKKKALSLIVAIVMVITMLPVMGLAADTPPAVNITSISYADGAVSLAWQPQDGVDGYRVYRKTGSSKWTVILSATTATSYTDTTAEGGTTYSYTIRSYVGSTYSTGYNATAKTITVLEPPPTEGLIFDASTGTVTGVEDKSITTLVIPKMIDGAAVTRIGDYAFSDCTGLMSVTIPSTVASIGEFAFAWCESLTSVTIPEGVTSIGNNAFSDCTALTSVTIPSSVTSIGSSAFYGCSGLTSISVASGNTAYTSVNGVLFTKDKKTIVTYPAGKSGAYTIPSGVTSIGNGAFNGCNDLASVTIPSSVTKIGDYAFYTCDGLKDVYYTGTQSEWQSISIDSYNDPLTKATIHYNSAN